MGAKPESLDLKKTVTGQGLNDLIRFINEHN
jgi:hypothetical protein